MSTEEMHRIRRQDLPSLPEGVRELALSRGRILRWDMEGDLYRVVAYVPEKIGSAMLLRFSGQDTNLKWAVAKALDLEAYAPTVTQVVSYIENHGG